MQIGHVIDRDNFEFVFMALEHCAQCQSADATETIDGNITRYKILSSSPLW